MSFTSASGLYRNSHLGISMAIVSILRSYKRPVPVDYLARELGRQRFEIVEQLDILEEEGIVKRTGGLVGLATEEEVT